MKRIVIALVFFFPLTTFAAEFTLSPQTISLSKDEAFSLVVRVHPTLAPVFTASMHLVFDPSMFEVTTVTIAPPWLALSQPEYDTTDNANGVLIKTAGYPGGISSLVPFGSITFRARRSGKGVISILTDSILLDASSTNRTAGLQGATTLSISEANTHPPPPRTLHSIEDSVPLTAQNAVSPPNVSSSTSFGTSSLAAVGAAPEISWNFIALVGSILFFLSSLWIRYRGKAGGAGINNP